MSREERRLNQRRLKIVHVPHIGHIPGYLLIVCRNIRALPLEEIWSSVLSASGRALFSRDSKNVEFAVPFVCRAIVVVEDVVSPSVCLVNKISATRGSDCATIFMR